MGTKSISLIVAVAVLVLASGPAVASGERVAASIESSLKVMDYNRAGSLYEDGKTWIHESLDASLRVATAYVEFAGKPEVLRYQSIPEECVSVAMECLEACDSMLEDDADDQARLKVARQYHIGAAIYIKAGVGDKGENAEKAALEHVEALAKLEIPPRGTHLLLGEIKLAMCKADPRKARTLIADARTAFDKAREIQGDSPALARCSAETVVKLAEVIELDASSNRSRFSRASCCRLCSDTSRQTPTKPLGSPCGPRRSTVLIS